MARVGTGGEEGSPHEVNGMEEFRWRRCVNVDVGLSSCSYISQPFVTANHSRIECGQRYARSLA
jgi:hypothetical protein